VKQILRFTTAGSVDDGKSTLIGRLLFDTHSVLDDQLSSLKATSEQKGFDYVDFSLLTDGLRAERDQGITIDVAYRYFETERRRFIIADTPGHIQYTRNMITGASNADLAVILVDARKGLVEQTLRHSFISSLLGIRQVVLCVNKMDLVEYAESAFVEVREAYQKFSASLNFKKVDFVPIAALNGENIVQASEQMRWYNGKTLLQLLEEADLHREDVSPGFRFPVQYVIRPKNEEYPDYRGFAGRIASGKIKVGDDVVILPSGVRTRISRIESGTNSLIEAEFPMSVSLLLADDVDSGRGSLIGSVDHQPVPYSQLEVMLCWLNGSTVHPGRKFLVRHHTAEYRGLLKSIGYRLDTTTFEHQHEVAALKMNDLAKVSLQTSTTVFADAYQSNRITGSIILIDEVTGETLAAGMIL